MNKRAQGLSLNTVIIAAIVIVVLIVLILIFTGGMSNLSNELPSCSSKGGYCDADCGAYNYAVRNTECDEQGLSCCVPRDDTDGSNCQARGGYCSANANSDNDVTAGREDCAHTESCWVESPCSKNGGSCKTACDLLAGEKAVSFRCRSYPDRLLCCKA